MFKKMKTICKRSPQSMVDLPDLPVDDVNDSLGFRRYQIAMRMIKSQCHNIDMPARANSSAIENLRQKLRKTACAKKLEAMRPDLSLWQRAVCYHSWFVSLAACFMLLCVCRVNISGLFNKSVTYSEDKVYNIYAYNCGDDEMLQNIFSGMRSGDERNKA